MEESGSRPLVVMMQTAQVFDLGDVTALSRMNGSAIRAVHAQSLMSWMWFLRNVRQVADGGLRWQTSYLATVDLGRFDADLGEFADDAGCAPERVGQGHSADEIAGFTGDRRSSGFP